MITLKRILAPVAFALLAHITANATDVVLRVSNNLDVQRQELAEVDAAVIYSRLGVKDGTPLVAINALGQEVPYQLTYDGKLLVEASVRPHGTASFTIRTGVPSKFISFTYGQVWPERLDDLTWENDRGIYRMYGPALQRTGERSFGTDVWTKSTPYLDVVKRYKAEFSVRPETERLRKAGKKAAVDSLYATISYHLDHGTGLDAYGVGATLGCGAPALMIDGQLVLPWCWTSCEILDNGPLRFTVNLSYGATAIGNDKNVVEHRLVSLDKGSNYNRITVWYDGLTVSQNLASGVVIHSADTKSINYSADRVLYADPTDRPERLNQQVYVGTVYPFGDVDTCFLPIKEAINGVAGHAVGITKYVPGNRFTYFFGSAWSANDVRSFNEWQVRSDCFINSQRNPLIVEVR